MNSGAFSQSAVELEQSQKGKFTNLKQCLDQIVNKMAEDPENVVCLGIKSPV